MDKNSTILEIRWGGKNPRIIYEDGASILFYIAGDYGSDMVTWQEKTGLSDFYKLDWDRYHGSSWIGIHNYELCEWIQNITIALVKNGVVKNNMYLATREIFAMKDDPTNEETIDKIYDILGKYFGNITGNFNKRCWNNLQPEIPGYNYAYRYDGIKDLIAVFLTGYACHYTKCNRYKPNDSVFNSFRSLRYKDMYYRSIFFANDDVNKDFCRDLATIYDRHHGKIETQDQAIARIRNNIIQSETGIEELITKNCITTERTNLTKETKNKIIEKIDSEIFENKKGLTYLEERYSLYELDNKCQPSELVREKEKEI